MTTNQERPKKLMSWVLTSLDLPWIEVIAVVWKLAKKILRGLTDEGMYEVLDYECTLVTCPPRSGPKPMLGLDRLGGRNNGKTEDIFSRTDHHEIARSRSDAWARQERQRSLRRAKRSN